MITVDAIRVARTPFQMKSGRGCGRYSSGPLAPSVEYWTGVRALLHTTFPPLPEEINGRVGG